MRIYLVIHLAALVMIDRLFRHVTGPVADWLNPLLWLGLLLSTVASIWIYARLLRRGTTFMKCAIAFSVAWLAFYVMWSWCIIFAARIIFARMIRVTDEAFLMFASSSGQQFDTWDRDSNIFFLTATLPMFMIAAILSLGIYFFSRYRTHATQSTA